MIEGLLFIGAGARAGAGEKINSEPELVEKGPAPQHCLAVPVTTHDCQG